MIAMCVEPPLRNSRTSFPWRASLLSAVTAQPVTLEDVNTPADLPIYKTGNLPDDNSSNVDAKRRKIDDAA